MVAAGILYVGGAVGMEMLESQEEFASDSQITAAYFTMVFIEECFEMSRVVLFFHTMVRFVETNWGALRLTVEAPTQAPAPADDTDSFRQAA